MTDEGTPKRKKNIKKHIAYFTDSVLHTQKSLNLKTLDSPISRFKSILTKQKSIFDGAPT